jgi:hypothetical protein
MQPEVVRAGIGTARCKLFGARDQRVKPGRDDKVLADWNGLMISSFARAGFHLSEPRYVDAAKKAALFARTRLMKEGRLHRSWKDGQAKHAGNLADHAFLAEGLLDLFEAAGDPADLAFAQELVGAAVKDFWDEKGGGFFTTAHDAELLIARSKEAYDGATPSGPSIVVMDLLRLGEFCGDSDLHEKAVRTLELYRPLLTQRPLAVSRMVAAVDFLQSEPREIVIAAKNAADAAPLLEVLKKSCDRSRVLIVLTDESAAALAKLAPTVEGKTAQKGKATVYVCRGGACQLPITDVEAFRKLLAGPPAGR